MEQWVKDDIERYETVTGHTFRTAHKQTKSGKYHYTIVLADLMSQTSNFEGIVEDDN